MIRYDPRPVDLTRNFFVLCTNVNIYLYKYYNGWSLARISMKERVNPRKQYRFHIEYILQEIDLFKLISHLFYAIKGVSGGI